LAFATQWLLPALAVTELGAIELAVPRTRTFSALKVVRAYARRAKDVDRMILACFVLGLSTRKVAVALLPILGWPVSPAMVSAVAAAPGQDPDHRVRAVRP
jgi:transposase-like protein